jgi:N-acetylglutamate synthase-like GNAT family acetyltransferase
MAEVRRLLATPLAVWEREGVQAALIRAGLPADDAREPHVLLWRFETYENIPAGFGGLEIHGTDALLRSLVTLPPLRQVGLGAGMVSMLETEARARNCRTIYLLTTSRTNFFKRLGYAPCARDSVPVPIRNSRQFAVLCPAGAIVMVKGL